MLFSKHHYSRLEGENEGENTEKRPSLVDRTGKYLSVLLLIISCFGAGILGFFAATYFERDLTPSQSELGYLPLDTVSMTFRYNRNFSDKPSDQTDEAWRSIFPTGGGFFAHPSNPSARSTFSVYHQLHCLDGLRYGYHMNREAALAGQQLLDENVPWDLKPHHMRHCIDLIRQALMCNADTTIEIVDKEVNGVHGFRTEHQCKDWQQLHEWTNERQRRYPDEVREHHH